MRDTAHLSMLEDGAYRRLLDAYYIKEMPLPADAGAVYRLIRAASKQEREAVDVVLKEFFALTPEGWVSERCEEEIAKYQEGESGRGASKESAKERQRRTRERRRELFEALRSHGIVPAYDTSTSELHHMLSRVTSQPVTRDMSHPVTRDDTATHKPLTNITPPTPPRGAVTFPPGFEEFWEAYPRKEAKNPAMRAFAKLRADSTLLASILASLAAARESDQWRRDGGKFIPHAATWLNQRRWEDDTPTAQPWDGAI